MNVMAPASHPMIGGRLVFSGAGSPAPILDALESALGLIWKPHDDGQDPVYYFAEAMGLKFMLEVARSPDGYRYELAYSSQARLYDLPAEVVAIDFHFVRLLETVGIMAAPLPGG